MGFGGAMGAPPPRGVGGGAISSPQSMWRRRCDRDRYEYSGRSRGRHVSSPTTLDATAPRTFPSQQNWLKRTQLEEEESPIVNLDPKAIINAALDPKGLIDGATKLAERAGDEAYFATMCTRRGLRPPDPPQTVGRLLLGSRRSGLLGGAVVAGGLRHGDRAAMIDERGE